MASSARAFTIDPLFSYFSRDRMSAHRLLPGVFDGYLTDLVTEGRCWVIDTDEDAVGFAGWLPPGGFPRGARRELRSAVRVLPSVSRAAHPVRAARLFAEVERRHPREPHWYLSLLAVDPDWQGRGLGGRLITPGLDAADDEGLPCYLETQKEANVAWYARFGFELTDVVRLAPAPPVWCLTRDPR